MDRVYHVPKDEIGRMVAAFVEMPGIEIIHEIDFNAVLSCWPDPIPDFGDAVIASLGKITRRAAIVTFDRKFTNNLKSLGLNFWDCCGNSGDTTRINREKGAG